MISQFFPAQHSVFRGILKLMLGHVSAREDEGSGNMTPSPPKHPSLPSNTLTQTGLLNFFMNSILTTNFKPAQIKAKE